ncbi:MAG: pilus assembly protein PilM [Planctomycetes bacterium]|jgi:type IV pilus assembly protein PilM|nr:pilus assembly protein PilM [Planctomycetota bacterium]
MARGTALGIDIGASSIKAVRLERRGAEIQATGVLKISTSEVPDEDYNVEPPAAAALAQNLAGAGIRARGAAVGVSGKDLILRYVEVPPVPPWRLKMIMEFEVGEMASRAGGDVTSNFRLLDLPPNKSGNQVVLVALAKNTYLGHRIDVLGGAGIGTGDLVPSSLALFQAFLLQGTPPPGETTLIVDVGARNTEMAIQRDGVLLFARNVSSGGNLFTKAVSEAMRIPFPEAERIKCKEGSVSRAGALKATTPGAEAAYEALQGGAGQFAALVRSSIQFCKSQTKIDDLKVDRIVLSGGGSRLKGLKESLAAAFRLPVDVLQPFGQIPVVVDDPEMAEQVNESPRDMSIAVGLAACALQGVDALPLLPERIRKRREFVERKVFLVGAGLAAAAFLTVGIVTGTHNKAVARTFGKQVDKQIGDARKIENAIGEVKVGMGRTRKVLDAVQAEASAPGRFLRVWSWIQKNLPDNVWLLGIDLKREADSTIRKGDATVVVTGMVEKTVTNPTEVLTQFVKKMRDALPQDIDSHVKVEQPKERDGKLAFAFTARLLPLPEAAKEPAEGEEDGGSGSRPSSRKRN